jgi:DNA-binding XRE family transcriptional regulator
MTLQTTDTIKPDTIIGTSGKNNVTAGDMFPTPGSLASFQESMDVAEGAHLVRTMREQAKLSQVELGNRVGITEAKIEELETGLDRNALTYHILKRIARACGTQFPAPQNT